MLPLLLILLIGTVYFGYVYVLQMAATHAAQQAAVAAVAVQPVSFKSCAAYVDKVTKVAKASVSQSLSWLPQSSQSTTFETGVCDGNAPLVVEVTISSSFLSAIGVPGDGESTGDVTGVAKIQL